MCYSRISMNRSVKQIDQGYGIKQNCHITQILNIHKVSNKFTSNSFNFTQVITIATSLIHITEVS